ncbi:hypothetical protein BH09BAC2_BH09BAC2_06180 [soil metagenome]
MSLWFLLNIFDIFYLHMKTWLLSFALLLSCNGAFAQGYKITLQTPNYKTGWAYLTYYFGKNINIQDSAFVNKAGIAVFKGDKKILPGIYSIVLPGKTKMFDFLIDKEQLISIKTDTTDLVNKTVIIGSKGNELFQKYQKFINIKSKLLQKEKIAYETATTAADSAKHKLNFKTLNEELNNYRSDVIKKYPKSMLATLFAAMKDPKLLNIIPVTGQDSLANYNYFKQHYWDDITFMDQRIIRTPFFIPKLETYFKEVLVQSPDSIIKEADYLLLLARSDEEMYKFLLNWLTDEYINPKYMGQDAVFVHLFEKYHSKGISKWLNEKQLSTISTRAYMLMSNLIGNKAADLKMVTSAGSNFSLYEMDALYTIIVFWDPTCGHCKEVIPKIDSVYKTKWKAQGVKIYAVLTENEQAKWKEYIAEHHLNDWINVYQTEDVKNEETRSGLPSYRQLYDVTQTPTIYLLNKEKYIIAKKLSWQQIDEVLQVKISKTN